MPEGKRFQAFKPSSGDISARMLRGILVMTLANAIFPLVDGGAKALVTTYGMSPATVAFLRLALQCLIMAPVIAVVRGRSGFGIEQPLLNLFRGVLMGLAGIVFFGSLIFMPLADAIAIFMVAPMLQVLLAVPILGETIGWRRVSAILVGFVGAVTIIRPSFAVFGSASLLPLVAAALLSLYLILSRFASRRADPLAMMFYAGLGGSAVVLLVMGLALPLGLPAFAFSWPEHGAALWLILAIGILGTIAHLLAISAYRDTPAGVLAPFSYSELVFAVVAGYLLFGDWPDALKFLGMGIIVASGLTVYVLERRHARRLDMLVGL